MTLSRGWLAMVALACGCAQMAPQPAENLGGTSWQLVRYQGGDGSLALPDDRSKYTLAFSEAGRVNVRLDCNRGRGTWKSPERRKLELGPLALTRAACPPGSMDEGIVKHWPKVRSYLVDGGHLFLRVEGKGGVYEFEPAENQVRGTVTLPERTLLPPNAVLEVTLEGVPRGGGAAQVVARAIVEQPGNPPIRFELPYEPSRIDPRRRYTVHARIRADERQLYVTERSYPVFTARHGTEVALRLRGTGGPNEKADEPLENTYWRLTQLARAKVIAGPQREPHLILHASSGRVSGYAGCNKLSGSYEVEGDRVAFARIAGALSGCAAGMETEKEFLGALRQASVVRVDGQALELLDASGNVVARFEAVHLK
jgi:putative lipoprotein